MSLLRIRQPVLDQSAQTIPSFRPKLLNFNLIFFLACSYSFKPKWLESILFGPTYACLAYLRGYFLITPPMGDIIASLNLNLAQ